MENTEFIMIRIDPTRKLALKERAKDLRLDGGVSELVKNLIDKELAQTSTLTTQPTSIQA